MELDMKKIVVRYLCFLLIFVMWLPAVHAEESALEIESESAILAEITTGQILFEKNPDERMKIASVTKVMTMLLIMESLHSGKISMEDTVTVSERACSMGGSQVYLSPGEQMSVSDMLKAIAVASANDASVAMAEHIMGSEEAFADAMNKRAKALGMENTNFINANGLDGENQYSSARDVAIMSCELMKHEAIRSYLQIWTDSLRDGAFGLANTNKLIRFYQGATGIKTGSTSEAKYCLSASAERDGLELVAVILAGPTSQDRFNNASKLLDHGFANYAMVSGAERGQSFGEAAVSKGAEKQVAVAAAEDFERLVSKDKKGSVEVIPVLPEYVVAPIKKEQKIGELQIFIDGEQVGTVSLAAQHEVKRITPWAMFVAMVRIWSMNERKA